VTCARSARGAGLPRPFLRDAALSRGPRGPELGTGSGKSLGGFGQSRSSSRLEPGSGPVEHEQLTAQPFNPMPGLRTGVVELAATARARREGEGGDDKDEHHRDQHHRGHQHRGHALDGTRRPRSRWASRVPRYLLSSEASLGPPRWVVAFGAISLVGSCT